jgi:hypothetical protein
MHGVSICIFEGKKCTDRDHKLDICRVREEETAKGEGTESDIPIVYSISSEHIDH